MPHDKNGNELRVGDRVLVECDVKAIYMTEDYCNVTLQTTRPMYPSEKHSELTLNAKQVELKK